MSHGADASAGSVTQRRRGRPAAGTEAERRRLVLDAAMVELVSVGPERLTMAAVARRAGASKETLYRWFGDREGLLTAVIQRNADQSAKNVEQSLFSDARTLSAEDVQTTLCGYAVGLLTLLAGEASVALNRAAMVDARLRTVLLTQGRHRVGPLVERFLEQSERAGHVELSRVGGVAAAFELLYGLVVRDTQTRVLLGEAAPSAQAISARAEVAIEQFLALCRPPGVQG